jgi:transposase-like protein
MKYIKEELIFNQKLSYLEIGRRYSVSDTYIKKIANKLGIKLKIRAVFPKDFKPANYGKTTKSPIFCLECKNQIDIYAKKYCSIKCQQKHQSDKLYKDFLENNFNYCKENYHPQVFKKRFLEEQNYKCAICQSLNIWNDKELIFVLDHIDGNAANNMRDNLRLVCPNCDSQLDTFKSKNKNSARKNRYFKQRNG